METHYWENYYKSNPPTEQPSLFARFVLENHLAEKDTLIELGSGNGRDAVFFARHGIEVLATDQCEEEIDALADKYDLPNLKFKKADFSKLGDIGTFDHVYSRFTLHSVSDEQESDTITWAAEHLKEGGEFLIEARGRKNEFYKLGEPVPNEPHSFIYEDHYRRFIDADKLREKLEAAGFEIASMEENTGFAPHKGTDQHFIRVIAVKK